MDFVAEDASNRDCPNGAFANMSLGGGRSDALNSAAARMVGNGIFVAVSAGNDNQDANNKSPASEPLVCTVGAIDQNDNRASFSNFGERVEIWAPGTNIASTIPGGGMGRKSGTSMAAPHIAGLAAYLASVEGPRSPALTCQRIRELSSRGIVGGIPDGGGNNNRLAFNGNPSG